MSQFKAIVACLMLFIYFGSLVYAQSEPIQPSISDQTPSEVYHFRTRQIVVPTIMIGCGVAAIEGHKFKQFEHWTSDNIGLTPPKQVQVDDFLQYAPAVSFYALHFLGVKGKSSLVDASVTLGVSALAMAVVVNTLKLTVAKERPDRSAFNSFPSGHTATAFMCAEFLNREFSDQSPWYGVAGYAVASTTGVLRVINNRHWFFDVAAGAGIGILSAKLAYWMQPNINGLYSHPKPAARVRGSIVPQFSEHSMGIGLLVDF